MNLQEQRLKFLNDSVEYFSIVERRCASPKCLYRPQNEKQTGCAIGGHLPKKLQIEFDAIGESNGIYCEEVFIKLPQKLKVLGRNFLSKIQALHDSDSNWNSVIGLTEHGQATVNYIKKYIIYENS